jgi:hypothetical protein
MKNIYTGGVGNLEVMGGMFGNVMGCVELGIVCVDYSVSGSGAVATHSGWWGMGGVAIPANSQPPAYQPLMTVALCLNSLGLERLDVVQ